MILFTHVERDAEDSYPREPADQKENLKENSEVDKKSQSLPHLGVSVPPILDTACLRETCLRQDGARGISKGVSIL